MSNSNREYGPREKITCNLPHGDRCASHHDAVVLAELESALCQRFGGYTATPMVGGWVNIDGNVMHENGTLYAVSYPATGMLPTGGPDNEKSNGAARRAAAIALFVEAGERLGEEWVHIERQAFEAEHRRTTNGRGEYDNSENGNGSDNGNSVPSNVTKIRQLDKETRDLINNGARSTEHVRR